MIKGIIFDLDGVLVSTDELHFKAWQRLAEELGIYGFTKEDNEKQRGVSRMESLEIVLKKGEKEFSPAAKVVLAEKKNDYYKELLKTVDETFVLSGVFYALLYLKEMGLVIGVGSASKNTPEILQRTTLEKYINFVSCGLDTTKSKPDPEVFLVAAKKMGLAPSECLVVEDSAAGIEAARRGGMKSLGVGPYYRELEADFRAKNLAEAIDWTKILA